tara:strand:- start:189 stop:842 length:654 start_codon:yes stop_codon:yes gene_type:complete
MEGPSQEEGQNQEEQTQGIDDQGVPIPEISNISFTPIIITRSQPRNNFQFLNNIFQYMSSDQPTSLEERIQHQSFNETPKFKQVTDKDFINSLSIQKVSQELVEKKITCGICLEELILGEDIIELPCWDKHYFHIKKDGCDGIYPWLKKNPTCPLCRYSFPSTEVKVEPEPEPETDPEQETPISIQPRIINIQTMIQNVIQEEEERMLQESILNSLQ